MFRNRLLGPAPAVRSPRGPVAGVLMAVTSLAVSQSCAAQASAAGPALAGSAVLGAPTSPVQAASIRWPASLSPLVTTPTIRSPNWSGHTLGGGPFTAVTGTFNVPHLTSASQPGEDFSEWVGIDGADNRDLIQAGVGLDTDRTNPAGFDIQAWWEICPAGETPITTMTVGAGDSVTVTIAQFTGTTRWQIRVSDNSSGQSFTTDQTYTGPADSAEWIVEAPKAKSGQTSIATYSPDVLFSNLQVAPSNPGTVERWVLADLHTGEQTSTPSALDSTGFDVAYGAAAPPAP